MSISKIKKILEIDQDPKNAIYEIYETIEDIKDKTKGEKGDKGDKPTKEELTYLIKPLIPKPIKGDKGDFIKGDKGDKGDKPIKGVDYFDGEDCNEDRVISKVLKKIPIPKDGKKGDKPKHEWKDTSLRFEKQDGDWGKWVNLVGPSGSMVGGGGVKVIENTTTKFVIPTVSLTGGSINEKGAVIDEVLLEWTVSKDMDRKLSPINVELGIGGSGNYLVSDSISSNTTYTITATDDAGNKVESSTSALFKLKLYYGVSSESNLSNSQILALNGILMDRGEIQFSLNCGGKYIFFAYPTDWGAYDVYVNGSINTEWDLTPVNVTNSSGYVKQYNLVRSVNKQFGENLIINLKYYGQ